MVKHDSNQMVWVALLAVVVFGVGAQKGLFRSTTSTQSTTTNTYNEFAPLTTTPQEQDGVTCSLALDKNRMCVGDTVTGTITSSSFVECYTFANSGTGWNLVHQGFTGATGTLSASRRVDAAGTANFIAVCDLNNNKRLDSEDCQTNQAILTVEACDPDTSRKKCCLAMGVYACYSECPPAGILQHTYLTEASCESDCVDPEGDGDGDGSDGGPVTYCGSPWPPASATECNSRDSTCPAGEYCVYYADTSAVPKHCTCQALSCDALCRRSGSSNGYCAYIISKDPCGANTALPSGNIYCKVHTLIGACCCG